MARPKKLGMDYFAHDCDASNDEKIEGLRALYGNDGYAFYFIMLERIYRSENFELDLSNADMKIILSRKISVQASLFEKILKSALNLNCFDKNAYETRHVLTSNGIKKRSEIVLDKRLKMQLQYKKNSKSKDNNLEETIVETNDTNSAAITEDTTQSNVEEISTETEVDISKDTLLRIELEPKPKTILETTEETTPDTTQSKVKKRKEKNNLLPKKILASEDDDFESKTKLVINYFLKVSGKKSIDVLDIDCAKDLLQFTDIDTIKAGIDTSFNRFKPKFKTDSIKTIRYCRSTINEIDNLKKDGSALNENSGMFANTINNEQDSITEIAQKYGVAAAAGTIQDFECNL